MALATLMAVPLAGCLGDDVVGGDGPEGPHQVLVEGAGYESVPLARDGRNATVPQALISPGGTRVALAYGNGDLELWSGDGAFLELVRAAPPDAQCLGVPTYYKFVAEETLAGIFGACPFLYSTSGAYLQWAPPLPQLVEWPALFSKDAQVIAYQNGSQGMVVRDTFGGRIVELGPLVPFDYHAMSPDGRMLALGRDKTSFYALDLANGTVDILGSFAGRGTIHFSDDGARAFRVPLGVSGSSDEVDLFTFSGLAPMMIGEGCTPHEAQAICPSTNYVVAGSPDARLMGWGDHVVAYQTAGPRTTVQAAAVVRVLDLYDHNWTRGF
jgi:hypothetical protein